MNLIELHHVEWTQNNGNAVTRVERRTKQEWQM